MNELIISVGTDLEDAATRLWALAEDCNEEAIMNFNGLVLRAKPGPRIATVKRIMDVYENAVDLQQSATLRALLGLVTQWEDECGEVKRSGSRSASAHVRCELLAEHARQLRAALKGSE